MLAHDAPDMDIAVLEGRLRTRRPAIIRVRCAVMLIVPVTRPSSPSYRAFKMSLELGTVNTNGAQRR